MNFSLQKGKPKKVEAKKGKKGVEVPVEVFEPPPSELFPVEKSLLEAYQPNHFIATLTCFVQAIFPDETEPR